LNNLYFHWMLDVLPRFQILARAGIDLAEIDYILIHDRLPFQQETLKILGIPSDKILSADRYSHLQATQLVVPSFPGAVAWMPQWTCNFLQDHFLPQAGDFTSGVGDRLYISRQQTANRRLINEAEVIDLLTRFGFKVVTLETLSVVEQAVLLSQAQVVVAPHGGGLTNLAFCAPGTKVIELFSPNYIYPCYWLVSNLAQLEYYYLLGEAPLGFHFHQLLYADPRLEDMYIDLNKLKTILQFAGIS
jgi:capsular polysaccharide biosynthesis protein